MIVGFAGLSHLGAVSAAAAAMRGFEVVAFDVDPIRVDAFSRRQAPFSEPGVEIALEQNAGRIQVVSDPGHLERCDVVVVALDVSTDARGKSDLGPVEDLLTLVARHVAREGVLVVLSQVPPGFTRRTAERLRRQHPGLQVVYQVETLVFGNALDRAVHPERIIAGVPGTTRELPERYARWASSFECPVLPMRYESAELAKIAINLCLVASISGANTLADVCEAVGADWSEIVPALRLDKRIGPHAYVEPGLGIAGGNLERDLRTVREIARARGVDARVVDAWIDHSGAQRGWVMRKLREIGLTDAPTTFALWGLAYKAGTSSTKNAPALDLLASLSGHRVRVYDPRARLDVEPEGVSPVGSAIEACSGASALIVMTAWPEFAAADLVAVREAMADRWVVDPFGTLDPERCALAGLRQVRRGAPTAPVVR